MRIYAFPFETHAIGTGGCVSINLQTSTAVSRAGWCERDVDYASPVWIKVCSGACVVDNRKGVWVVSANVDVVDSERAVARVLDGDPLRLARLLCNLISEIDSIRIDRHPRATRGFSSKNPTGGHRKEYASRRGNAYKVTSMATFCLFHFCL